MAQSCTEQKHIPHNYIVLFFILINLVLCYCTISSSKIKERKIRDVKRGPLETTVFERNLVSDKPNSKDILRENQAYFKNTNDKNFNGSILGYVTPWNGHGYDVAQVWADKFNFISPVWLQVNRESERKYIITGQHDIDQRWMNNLQSSKVCVMPRVLFENWNQDDISSIEKPGELKALSDALYRVCDENNFNGIVLELWFQFFGHISNKKISHVVRKICSPFITAKLQCIIVAPPWHGSNHPDLFSKSDFDYLHSHVTGVSLMTYDFSNPQRPGPNAPVQWIKKCIEHLVPNPDDREKRKLIFMGLNIYGYAYTPQGGGHILAPDYINMLGYHKGVLKYDQEAQEHFFEVKTSENRFVVFYPTLFSINTRIQLAKEMNVNLALWELGQGLDYFYDLF